MADSGQEFDKIKRRVGDVLYDLQERKLAIPAGILVVLIVGAIFVLPKSPAPPPPVQTAPTANTATQTVDLTKAADLTLIGAVPLTDSPLTFGSQDPFDVNTKVKCHTTKNSPPREFECLIGSTIMRYRCMASDKSQQCTGSGSSGSTGASGTSGAGGSGGTGSTGASGGGGTPKKKSTYYVVNLTFDGKSVKNVVAGDVLPTSGASVVFYAGPNSKGNKAIFVLADGVTVQGATADDALGTFEISTGDEVVLTTAAGEIHQMKLNKISKVTK